MPGQPALISRTQAGATFACRESRRSPSHPVPGRPADVTEGGGMFRPAKLPEPHDIRHTPEEAGFAGNQAVGPHPREAGTLGRLDGTPVVFWQALNPVERDAFRSFAYLADIRRRAPGSYRKVIHGPCVRDSQRPAQIRVEKTAVERVVAIRGPGQLVGERAVLQISVRSASVIALDRCRHSSRGPRDFATFISAIGGCSASSKAVHDRHGGRSAPGMACGIHRQGRPAPRRRR